MIYGVRRARNRGRESNLDKAKEMGNLNVPDRYIDAFCGRTPKTVLARHYSDYSWRKQKERYDKAGLRVLS